MKKLILIAALMLPSVVWAQLLIDPVSKAADDATDFGMTFGTSEIEYDADDGKVKVDRDYLGVTGAYGISSDLDFYAAGAYTIESKVEGASSDDDGMILATGLRSTFAKIDEVTLSGYGQVQLIAEDYGNDVDSQIFETNFGIVNHVKIFDPVGFYAGIDFTPFSDGEIDTRAGDIDLEREDLFGLRFGADVDLDTWKLRLDYAVISEETLTIGASFKL